MTTAVLGAGSWGTTFAKVIADAGHPVTLWARRAEVADEISTRGTNSAYLGDLALGENVVPRRMHGPRSWCRCGRPRRPRPVAAREPRGGSQQ